MKKLLLFLLALMPMMLLTACSDDDEESSIAFDVNTIVGTWEITEREDNTIFKSIEKGGVLRFNYDGTCETEHSMEDSYKIDNGLVKTYYKKTLEPIHIYKLLSKEADVLKVRINGTLDESRLSVVIQMTRK